MTQGSAMSTAQPDTHFVQSIEAAIAYWRANTRELKEEGIVALDAERQNLLQAVRFGLRMPQLRQEAARLALQLYLLLDRRAHWREWIPVLEEAAASCDGQNPALQCALRNRLGQLYRRERRLEEAIATHLSAAALARRGDDFQAEAESYFHLAEDYRVQRNYERAQQYAEAALEQFRQLGSERKWIAGALNTLGIIATWRGDLPEAEGWLREAVACWRELQQPTELARALSNLGGVLRNGQQYEEARRCYLQAREHLAGTASELDKVKAEIALGGLYFEEGEYAAAEAAFRAADSPYLRRSGHAYYRAYVAQGLGNVFLKQGQLAEAEDKLHRSVQLWRRAQDRLMLANTLGTLAEALAEQGRGSEAVPYYEEALKILEAYPEDAWARKLQREFSRQRGALPEAGEERESAP